MDLLSVSVSRRERAERRERAPKNRRTSADRKRTMREGNGGEAAMIDCNRGEDSTGWRSRRGLGWGGEEEDTEDSIGRQGDHLNLVSI